MPEPDETPPAQPDPSLPTNLGGIDPGELLARGMHSAKMSGGGAHGWEPPTPEEVAHLFPSYEILSMLGRGGMGAVYKARQTALDRLVAIKLLPLEISVDQAFADRFRREARAMAKMNHPHIISVFDFGQTAEGHLFFAMEFVEGANLHDIIHGPGLAPDQALSIAVQICTALAYAHGKGVVHRDMKPANVMVDTDGQVKVADFGLARLTDTSGTDYGHTMTGTVMGTPDYMAPEQMKGMNVDHRADIYSLGVMLYEMLCRETPRGAFDLPSARTGCDPRLDKIVLKAMQQAPERRYQSTQEMKADVETARTPLPASPPPAAAQRPLPKALPRAPKLAGAPASAKKSRAPLLVASAVALAVLAGAAVFISKRGAKEEGAPIGQASRLPAGESPQPPPASGTLALQSATKDAPFVNTLGMKFVPVPITGGPTGGQRVLFSVWETRVQDYEVFAKETKREWPKPGFEQGPTHPAVHVSWEDATAFCAWLTERERKAGKLGATEHYRLPSDHEWSCAVGIGEREEAAKLPNEKEQKIADVFPWGSVWPPPAGAGNYAGGELQPAVAAGKYSNIESVLSGYRDGFVETAPAGSFPANRFGLFDLGGNAWEWCEDWYDDKKERRLLRGASWDYGDRVHLLAAKRNPDGPTDRSNHIGFRSVVAMSAR